MRHGRIIDQLGGWWEVANSLSLNPSTVWRWKSNGIPPGRWPAIITLARKAGLVLTTDQLMRDSPVCRKGVARLKDTVTLRVS